MKQAYFPGDFAYVFNQGRFNYSMEPCEIVRKLDTSVDGYDELEYYLVRFITMHAWNAGREVTTYDVVNNVNLRIQK